MSLDAQTGLLVHSTVPFNAEPALDRLRSAFVTATRDFYIRSHGAVPAIDRAAYRLRVEGRVGEPLSLSLAELQSRFAARTVTAVMQCAGNRRADLQQVRPTTGDPWAAGAIGNAQWTGVALADVLRAAGAPDDAALHVAFTAADIAANEGAPDAPFGASIPMAKARAPEVLLAWAMNGEPLTPEHGAPLRVVVPGYAGVRSPKWLATIRVQEQPSAAFQQQLDYLLFPPDMREDTADPERGSVIYAMPLNSAICEPEAGAALAAGEIRVRGYAVASDRAIIRVDVSADGGRGWQQATIEESGDEPWSWTLWHATLAIARGDHELVVRAWDAAGQTQPALPDDTWNFKGYLSAAWHRVRVTGV